MTQEIPRFSDFCEVKSKLSREGIFFPFTAKMAPNLLSKYYLANDSKKFGSKTRNVPIRNRSEKTETIF